ncbi:hypothetical protein PAXRUDRAFT_832901 [Paxillus rubicundulus Ve08.2h10]|uniref:Uncharacterized protein n=1 Tax=Paxillus rubicundulus Ve08.2h10 TaxID=930991 RepID=A0A0D0CF62_9AGAM|nr:hypothetical protein PAXRUDRAFT_832901 [Paxillus rubicundulus Ve08.2h10]
MAKLCLLDPHCPPIRQLEPSVKVPLPPILVPLTFPVILLIQQSLAHRLQALPKP